MDASAQPAQQLAEFIAAVSSASTEPAAARAAVEHAAEALDAEAAAIVCHGEVVAAVGYPEGMAPVTELEGVRPGAIGASLEVPRAGRCAAAAVTLEYPPGARLVLARPGPGGLDREETGLLRAMAGFAAMTMRMLSVLNHERAARQELERLADEQTALRRVSTLVARAASAEKIFSAVAEEVTQLSGTDLATVLRYEPDGSATVVGSWGDHGGHLAVGTRRIVAGAGPVVSVRRTGRAARTLRFTGPGGSVADAFRQAGVQAATGSPIIVEGRLWGVVIAARTQARPLSRAAEQRIPAFTELAATAIANAQAGARLRAAVDEQAALRRVATLVGRGAPPAEVFAAVALEVGRVLDADLTFIERYDAEREATIEVLGAWTRTGASSPVPIAQRVKLEGRKVSTVVFETGQPARVDEFGEDAGPAQANAEAADVRSAAAAPILIEDRVWGVMIAGSTREDPLPAGTEARLADFTELVATAIANAQARVELRGHAEEQAALRRVATLVARGAKSEEVLTAVTDEVGRLLEADLVSMDRYDPEGTVTVLAARPATLAAGWSIGGRNVSTLVFQTGRPARIDDYAEASGPGADPSREWGVRAAVGVPITIEGRLWGVMFVGSRHERALPADTEDRLAEFTELVATAIANAEAQAALRASRARIAAAADTTRRRIERDLHDGAQQRLVSLALQLRAAQAAVPPGAGQLAAQLDQVAGGLTGVLDELRDFGRGIHPAILADGGLGPALRTLARRCPIPVTLDVQTGGRLPEPVEVCAYYLVSEALANAAKHSHASTVTVQVTATGDVLQVRVGDDGAAGARIGAGSGLIGLKDRVEALGGQLALYSQPGEGTSITARLPLAIQSP